jgi:hypothetical protein
MKWRHFLNNNCLVFVSSMPLLSALLLLTIESIHEGFFCTVSQNEKVAARRVAIFAI